MKLHKQKWWRDRLYEVYLQLEWTCCFIGVIVADIDFEIHLTNLRGVSDRT